jgi:predicted nicotinamide N-methyase
MYFMASSSVLVVAYETNGTRRDGHPIMLRLVTLPRWMTFAEHRLALPGGELRVLQPSEAAELPDDGPVEWAPLVPYWSVLWRSGVALARALPEDMRGLRVIELGCGLGVPSLVAARAGAEVLATDFEPEALELVEVNSANNGVRVETALLDWGEAGDLGEFDLVLAADVLYERQSVKLLLELLPRLAPEAWIADPGRKPAEAFFEQVRMPVRRITP